MRGTFCHLKGSADLLPGPLSDRELGPFDAPGLVINGPPSVVMFTATPRQGRSRFTVRLFSENVHFVNHTYGDAGSY